MNTKSTQKNELGIALLFTLILVAIFFILGMAFMSRANFSAQVAKNLQESEEARIGANIALDHIKTIMEKNFSTNTSRPAIADHGMTFPVWEAKRIDSDGTVHSGVDRNSDWAFRSYPQYDGIERALLSRRSILGEVNNNDSQVDLYFNKYGNVEKVDGTASAYYNIVVDPDWEASASDPQRYGYRYAFALLDKSSFHDINATRQEGHITFPNTTKPAKGVTYAEQNVTESYVNVDLSNIWADCDHDPSTNPIFNFDELYGRTEVNGTKSIPSPPSLAGANPTPIDDGNDDGHDSDPNNDSHHAARHDTRYRKGQMTYPGDFVHSNPDHYTSEHYSFMHATAPYSITETFPAYDASNKEYTVYDDGITSIKKSHSRFDLTSIDNNTSLATILNGIQYLNRWVGADNSSLPIFYEDIRARAFTIAANIKDYIDKDLSPTLVNYTPMGLVGGGVITAVPEAALGHTTSTPGQTRATVCGNERVPYLNEILIMKHRKGNADPYLCVKAELVWLYGQIPAGQALAFSNYKVKARIKVKYDQFPWNGDPVTTGIEKTLELELTPNDTLVNNAYPNESDNYFVTNTAYINIDQTSDTGSNMANPHTYKGNAATSFLCDNFEVLEATFELLIDVDGGGVREVVDIASLNNPGGEAIATFANEYTGATRTRFFTYSAADPRNNTHRYTKRYDHETGTFKTIYNWKAGNKSTIYNNPTTCKSDGWGDMRVVNKYFPGITDLDSIGAANYWNLAISNTGQSRTRGYEGTFANYSNYDYCDVERMSSVYLYNEDGTKDGARRSYDPATGSNRYMPLNGGIHHEAELGLISRGVNHQTLNLTVYNLSQGNDLLNAAYTQQNDDHNGNDHTSSHYYDPVPNGIANGGDREILDHVYITDDTRTDGTYSITVNPMTQAEREPNLPAGYEYIYPAIPGGTQSYSTPTATLNNLEQEKKVYGKFNPNSLRMHTFKTLFMSMSIPSAANGDYTRPPGLETGHLTDMPQASSLLTVYNSADQLRFMNKFTYDKTEPLSATNAPNDPMRWGSKRWGAMFSHRSATFNSYYTSSTAARHIWSNEAVTLNDRERETLLLKTKDYITTRYTLYSGVVVGERMLFTRDINPAPPGWKYVADPIPLAGTSLPAGQVKREGLLGKSISLKKFRVECAYDHFLDKFIILDYKYMGKLQ